MLRMAACCRSRRSVSSLFALIVASLSCVSGLLVGDLLRHLGWWMPVL
jgi:hypothetical protein